MHLCPVTHVLSFCVSTRLVHKSKASSFLLVDLLVILVYDVIVKLRVLFMPLDPSSLNSQHFADLFVVPILLEIFGAELKYELLILGKSTQRVLVLIDLTLGLGDLLIKLLDFVLLGKFSLIRAFS